MQAAQLELPFSPASPVDPWLRLQVLAYPPRNSLEAVWAVLRFGTVPNPVVVTELVFLPTPVVVTELMLSANQVVTELFPASQHAAAAAAPTVHVVPSILSIAATMLYGCHK